MDIPMGIPIGTTACCTFGALFHPKWAGRRMPCTSESRTNKRESKTDIQRICLWPPAYANMTSKSPFCHILDALTKIKLCLSRNGVCLVGKSYPYPVGVFCTHLEAPKCHIERKLFWGSFSILPEIFVLKYAQDLTVLAPVCFQVGLSNSR